MHHNFKKEDFKFYRRGAAYLFVSEGAFAFSSDVLAMSHHHEVLCPPLFLVASAGVRVEFGSLLHKFLPVAPSRLEQSKTNDIKTSLVHQTCSHALLIMHGLCTTHGLDVSFHV